MSARRCGLSHAHEGFNLGRGTAAEKTRGTTKPWMNSAFIGSCASPPIKAMGDDAMQVLLPKVLGAMSWIYG